MSVLSVPVCIKGDRKEEVLSSFESTLTDYFTHPVRAVICKTCEEEMDADVKLPMSLGYTAAVRETGRPRPLGQVPGESTINFNV